MKIPTGQSSTVQPFEVVEGEKTSQSADSSGRKTSIGSDTPAAEKASTFSSKIDKTPEQSDSASDLSGRVTKESVTPTIQKVIQSVKNFFQPLIDKFKELKRHFTGQKSSQIPAEVKAESTEGKMKNTLDKFNGKAENRQEFTLEDQKNLNEYFSGGDIDSGVDKLVDIYEKDPDDVFELLETLTPENQGKVQSKLEENIGDDFTIKQSESEGKIGDINGRMESAVNELKEASNNEDIKKLIENIRSQSDALCPKNASEEFKLSAEIEVKSSALKELPEGSAGRTALQKDVESLVLKRAGIDSFDNIGKLYADSTKIESGNEAIISLAKINPEKAGEVLARGANSDKVQESGGKLDGPSKKAIAQEVFSKIKNPTLRQKMLKGALKANIERAPQPTTILRESGFVEVQLMQIYISENVRTEFSQSDSLKTLLENIPSSSKQELGDSFQSQMEEAVSSILNEATTIATNKNNSSIELFSDLLAEIKTQADKKFPKEDTSSVARDQVFLRVINPMITDENSVKSTNTDQMKNRSIAAQLVQKLSTGAKYQDSNTMSTFNNYLQSEPLQEFKTKIDKHISTYQ